jgi:recombination protein RecT
VSQGQIQPAVTAEKKIEAMLGRMHGQLAKVLPKHITPERMSRVTMNGLTRNPKLLECTPRSIAYAIMLLSELGLEPNGPLGESYLIPHWNGKTRTREATPIPGYQGILKLARQSPDITDIYPYIVYEKDVFSIKKGSEPSVEHEPFIGDAGQAIGYYCVVKFKSGGQYFEFITRAQAEQHRDQFATARSREGKVFGPWVEHFDRMALKTVIIKTLKLCPKSVEVAKAIQAVEWEGDVTGTVEAPQPEEAPAIFHEETPPPRLMDRADEARQENRQDDGEVTGETEIPLEDEPKKRGPNTSTCLEDINQGLEILGAEAFHELLNDMNLPAGEMKDWPVGVLRDVREVLLNAVSARE